MSALTTPSPDYLGYIYAGLLTFGGLMGARKGSFVSLIMGAGSGAVAGYGAYRVSNDKHDVYVSLGIAWLLTLVMGARFGRSFKFVPAGLIMVLSLIMGTYYTLQLSDVPDL